MLAAAAPAAARIHSWRSFDLFLFLDFLRQLQLRRSTIVAACPAEFGGAARVAAVISSNLHAGATPNHKGQGEGEHHAQSGPSNLDDGGFTLQHHQKAQEIQNGPHEGQSAVQVSIVQLSMRNNDMTLLRLLSDRPPHAGTKDRLHACHWPSYWSIWDSKACPRSSSSFQC